MFTAYWVAIRLLAVGITMALSGGVQLNPKIVAETGFAVVGISTRTTNEKEMSGNGVIAKQWDRFMKEGLLIKIPNRVDSNILVVYTDYESDANGAYTYIIGARVSSVDNIPSGMVAKKVPAGRYALFTSEKGIVGKIVPETWGRIWAVPKSAPGGNRAYQADFEVYDERSADPQNAQVDKYFASSEAKHFCLASSSGRCLFALDERKQIRIDLVLMGRAHSVRRTWINLQCPRP